MTAFESLPWMVPIPVRPVRMATLRPEQRHLAIETDLARIAPFSMERRAVSVAALLYADQQTNADVNVFRRLGSGRSGFYRGMYLKGIGRTTLAANWNDARDRHHSSGLMLPTAAIREWLVSTYLASRGVASLVNPCTGLLLRPLGDLARGTFGFPRSYAKPVDRALRAISVKDGDFHRCSNFVWCISNLPIMGPERSLATFFEALWRGLHPRPSLAPTAEDGAAIAERFAHVVATTVDRFIDAWAHGIHWHSPHNNFTLDGRFLDLETAEVLPAPLMGGYTHWDRAAPRQISLPPSQWKLGLEALSYARQMRDSVRVLVERLSSLAQDNMALLPPERSYVREFVRRLRRAVAGAHPLASPQALTARVVPRMAEVLDLSSSETRTVSAICLARARSIFTGRSGRSERAVSLYRLELPELSQTYPGHTPCLYVPTFLRERARSWGSQHLDFNLTMARAGRMNDAGAIFGLLQETERRWNRRAGARSLAQSAGSAW